jgi:small-conductance mechanosensitive channel
LRALEERGIEIPFPQRDLHIRSLPEGMAAAGRRLQGGVETER